MASQRKGKWGVLILLLLIVIIYILLKDNGDPGLKLIGTWKIGEHDIQFNENNTYEDRVNGVMYDNGEYSVDFSQNPAWVNIVSRKGYRYSANPVDSYFFAGIPTLPLAKGIVRLVTDNEIELAFTAKKTDAFGNGKYEFRMLWDQRPSSFETTGETTINTLIRSSNSIGWQAISYKTSNETFIVPLTRIMQ